MYQISNIYCICSLAAIGGGLVGFGISSMSAVVDSSAYKQYFGDLTPYQQGGITASMPAGSIFGSLVSAFVVDRYSCMVALQLACALWISGAM
ncbi:hypothetical protein GGR52DRAFT_516129 [Hypoxylon sp. FL1284]|nr:hypothetical protein GGR52DRAFT_516129 [Hypoxylon sp. FL1284]